MQVSNYFFRNLISLPFAFFTLGGAGASGADVESKLQACEKEIVAPLSWPSDPRSQAEDASANGKSWTDLRLSNGDQGGAIDYIGAKHVTSPDPDLFSHIEAVFDEIHPTVAYVETANLDFVNHLPATKDEVLQHWGEPRYLAFVAKGANVPVKSLELAPSELRRYLLSKFPAEKVALALTLRTVELSRDRNRAFGEGLEAVVDAYLQDQKLQWKNDGKAFPISNIYELTILVHKYWPALSWRDAPANWFDPLVVVKDTGSLFVNDVVREEMVFRDHRMYSELGSAVMRGEHVIAIVGRSHMELQQFALRCLAQPPP